MKIALVAPAKRVSRDILPYVYSVFKPEHFSLLSGKHVFDEHHYLSSTIENRIADFQSMLDDPEIDIILCAAGGYGTIHIIESLNFSSCLAHSKKIVGFSDITVLHCKMHTLGVPSIHAAMPNTFQENSQESLVSLVNAITGGKNYYEMNAHYGNRTGIVRAPVVGGNLAILVSLLATPFALDTAHKLLFIEEVGESIYRIERMLWQLKLAGKLEKIKGLIIGGMTKVEDTHPSYGKWIEEMIVDMVRDYVFPVCFGFPAGHIIDNRAIILGKEACLSVDHHKSTFAQ